MTAKREMSKEEAIKNIKEHCYFANLNPQAKEALDMAIKALEREANIRELGNELRLVRGGIKGNKDMLCGYNLAVSICNKYLAEKENEDGERIF